MLALGPELRFARARHRDGSRPRRIPTHLFRLTTRDSTMPITSDPPPSLASRVLGRLRLRFPGLFFLLLALTVADLAVPDFIPWADEIGLALITLLLGSWKERRTPPPRDAG